MMDFDKIRNGSEEDLFDDNDLFDMFDTEEDIENRNHNHQWGKYLFELHTKKGSTPVTPEIAATLSYRDLECLMLYPTPEEFDFLTDDVADKTITACANELHVRDQRIEESLQKL